MNENTVIESVEQLKEACAGQNADVSIILNGGLRSSKVIQYDGDVFHILNEIDDSEQELTEEQLMDTSRTFIGEAIKKKALVFNCNC